jgi:tetratricopeptide (TPR) repeat protein
VEASLQILKAVETKKDPALIKKWALATSDAARKVVASPQPQDAEEVESWKKSVEYARQVDTYSEYAVYRAALEVSDPKTKIDLSETLLQRNPKSEYAPKVNGPLFLAYRQTGDNEKAVALAEQVLVTDQSDEDMLLVVTDSYLQKKKEPEKVHAYSAKIVELMSSKAKPEGVSDADWQSRKNLFTGLAHYMSGKQYFSQSRFPQADKELRQALPLVESNATLKPEVLFMLGLSNYKMQKVQEAANFFKACAAVKSPFQSQSLANLKVIRTEYRGVK